MLYQTPKNDLPTRFDASWLEFWRQAFALQGSITPAVIPNVICVGVVSALICWISSFVKANYGVDLTLEIAPYEFTGAALGLLLVLRTNSGYDRWWEARKLWGGIVNQSRNFVINCLNYGPNDDEWRKQIVNWTIAFCHTSRHSLRAERPGTELVALIGREGQRALVESVHMPSFVAMTMGALLKRALDSGQMSEFAYLQADRERCLLIDHIGGCERILKTPLALAYSIKIRRFISIFLLTLPFAITHQLTSDWLVPLVVMLVAYPLFSLDQLGVELQDPFCIQNLGHLPLGSICDTIEGNLFALQEEHLKVKGLCDTKTTNIELARSIEG